MSESVPALFLTTHFPWFFYHQLYLVGAASCITLKFFCSVSSCPACAFAHFFAFARHDSFVFASLVHIIILCFMWETWWYHCDIIGAFFYGFSSPVEGKLIVKQNFVFSTHATMHLLSAIFFNPPSPPQGMDGATLFYLFVYFLRLGSFWTVFFWRLVLR